MSVNIRFPNREGQTLSALLDLPAGQIETFALFVHCFTCSKDSLAAFRISKALASAGIAVLRFDFTGLGSSEGDFANTNFSSNLEDVRQAIAYLRDNYQTPSLLIGHSLGGAAVLEIAGEIAEIKAVATIGAPADLQHVTHLFSDKIPEINQDGAAEVTIAGRHFQIKKHFIDDLAKQAVLKNVAALKKPTLFFHSMKDQVVDIEHAYELMSVATGNKSLITLAEADHLLIRAEDANYVAQLLLSWAKAYLPLAQASAEDSAQVVVREGSAGKFVRQIVMGEHELIADEPQSVGGNNLGPNPYDLLLASLGACTSLTLRMYANLKKLPLDDIVVKLNHHKKYAVDCADCENKKTMLDFIEVEIMLQGDLTDAQKEKLLEIANKCPVHRTLASGPKIKTKMV